MEQVIIKGITYDVIKRESTESIAQRFPNIARILHRNGVTSRLTIRKPKGTNSFWVNEQSSNGRVLYSRPAKVPTF